MQSTECLIRMTPSSGPEAQRVFFTQVDYFRIARDSGNILKSLDDRYRTGLEMG